ncbi:hypothetical protein [Bowmanella denitrificans]|uniref:hypothetical protein n=1 Tax=Bowmanella denitrificans TaxID=366582 RepID=UPI000C9AA3C2|nr:hypothetical protein [Bowmanella denitrificans]
MPRFQISRNLYVYTLFVFVLMLVLVNQPGTTVKDVIAMLSDIGILITAVVSVSVAMKSHLDSKKSKSVNLGNKMMALSSACVSAIGRLRLATGKSEYLPDEVVEKLKSIGINLQACQLDFPPGVKDAVFVVLADIDEVLTLVERRNAAMLSIGSRVMVRDFDNKAKWKSKSLCTGLQTITDAIKMMQLD